MPWWLWLVDSLAFVVLLTALGLAGLVFRRRYIARGTASFDLSTNRGAEHGAQGWMLGLAVYRGEVVEWYRTFSFTLRPKYRFVRGEVVVEGRRTPEGAEAHAVHAGHLVVTTQNPCGVEQLAMSPASLTGLLAWLEAAPPGRGVNTVL